MDTSMDQNTYRDFKKLIKSWNIYQKTKIKVEMERGGIPCSFSYRIGSGSINFHGARVAFENNYIRLNYGSELENILNVRMEIIIGYNVENNNIHITFEPTHVGFLNLQFPNVELHALALEKLENLLSETGPIPTSPSSSSSSSGDE